MLIIKKIVTVIMFTIFFIFYLYNCSKTITNIFHHKTDECFQSANIDWTKKDWYLLQCQSISLLLLIFTTTILILLSTSTCGGDSHIINTIYTYIIIRISLFVRLGNIYIICIYDIIYTISISLTWNSCGHCPHPLI